MSGGVEKGGEDMLLFLDVQKWTCGGMVSARTSLTGKESRGCWFPIQQLFIWVANSANISN
jgi:hypothetical protein